METYYCKSFLKYIHVWKEFKRSHHIIGETNPQLDMLWHQEVFQDQGWVTSCWILSQKGPLASPSIIGYCKAVGCSLQPYSKTLLLRTNWWSPRSLTPYWLAFTVLEVTLCSAHCAPQSAPCTLFWRRKVIVNITQLLTLWPTAATCLWQTLGL